MCFGDGHVCLGLCQAKEGRALAKGQGLQPLLKIASSIYKKFHGQWSWIWIVKVVVKFPWWRVTQWTLAKQLPQFPRATSRPVVLTPAHEHGRESSLEMWRLGMYKLATSIRTMSRQLGREVLHKPTSWAWSLDGLPNLVISNILILVFIEWG